ncbi:MAG: efflux RND transporter periplasmic adaptor subunit [Myxococcales bacterium]|nr:efflux RND transporter periplasmic adaptor subunit [Myxococcales bacterium]
MILLLGCGRSGSDAAHDDHGHGATETPELPGQSVTIWAERTELFMEYRPLLVGSEARFAAHVTEMPTFRAVTDGRVTLTLTYADGTNVSGAVDAPSNPGIFRPALTPTKVGPCELRLSVASPQVEETFAAGACEVFADETAARAKLGDDTEPPGRITFLKEQQWKTDFGTVAAAPRDLQDGVRASGEIRPVAGREAEVGAPVAGRVTLSEPAPILGMPVKAGQVLASISPRAAAGGDRATMAADVEANRAEVEAARAELARAERLVADQAAPGRVRDEARTRVTIAEARAAGARGRLAQFDASAAGGGGARRFQLRAPIDGTLVAISAASGENVDEGRALFSVIDLDRVWLVAKVFEPDLPRVEGARAAWFTVEGYAQPFTVDETNARLVTIGRVIDPRSRTAPVIFELDNRAGKLRIGNFARLVIATGAPRTALAIPASALVDDAGRSIAYVMIEGEAFERRPLRVGLRSNEWVEVLEGVAAGEHVVTRGAYEIKLQAAAGSVPAHGHVH